MHSSDSHHPVSSLQGKLEKLYTYRGGGTADLTIRPDLYSLLHRLSDPHLSLPPVFHVAGTNGKGSVLAILEAIFKAGGYSVHKYTSPHLITFNERIMLNGAPIDDNRLEALLDEVTTAMDGLSLTFFEITTALAFLAFSRHPADVLLLETGLGGRLDCTNVICDPLMTMITTIGLDHAEFLGETLTSVAYEKAGIMKPGAPCVITPQADRVMAVMEARANDIGSRIEPFGETWRIDGSGPDMTFHAGGHDMILPYPALPGRHQVINAGVAVAALFFQDHFAFTEEAISKGLRQAVWPGRLQELQGQGHAHLPPGWRFYVDGGHNESAGDALSEQMAVWKRQAPDQEIHLILGMMNTKDPVAFVQPMIPYLKTVTAVPIAGEDHAHSPQSLRKRVRKLSPAVKTAPNLKDAVASIVDTSSRSGIILFAGSLYLAGRVLQHFGGERLDQERPFRA